MYNFTPDSLPQICQISKLLLLNEAGLNLLRVCGFLIPFINVDMLSL